VPTLDTQPFEATENGRREARALYSLSRQMTSLDLEHIPERLLGQLGDLISNDVAGLLVEIDGILYSFFHVSQPMGEAMIEKLERSMLDHWPALTSPAPAATLIQRHMQNENNVLPDDTPALRSDIYALLFVGERPLGALTVARTGLMEFEEEDQRLLSTIANQVATAIENALLYRQLKAYAASLERRVAERTIEIARQKERTEAILHSVADAVLVTDPQGAITLTNERARYLLDGQLHPEDREHLVGRVREWGLQASEEVEEIVELGNLALQARATPISEEDPSLGAVVVLSDVSRLRELDRLKTLFVSNVSHELRTPISNIKLYLALLERGKPEKRERYLNVVRQESTRLENLIENLLDLSRLDAGRMQIIPRPVNLEDLVTNLVKIHRQAAAAKDLRLKAQFSQVPPANGDRNQITQVLTNLIANATSYTPPGGEIAIRLGTAEAEGRQYVTIAVVDTGIGIPPDELPHIFDRFFRGEQSRTLSVPGTGLGLAIVQEIVELHQGRIEVQSEVGQGSTFAVWLPTAVQTPVTAASTHCSTVP
jgi:signal transduction histidine kinase